MQKQMRHGARARKGRHEKKERAKEKGRESKKEHVIGARAKEQVIERKSQCESMSKREVKSKKIREGERKGEEERPK